ncbi:hypothetical protein [Streptomyces hyaluromycini]|uniref:hypothetical protein n=1 Tax=Streptomyces hyaluromycini TaxID=1377993 RepID=UPI000B5CA46B|nr:hypothetical protein [Streptomyces hyaluromycini]
MTGHRDAVRTLAAFDPGPDAGTILDVIAWCASAAGVGGLIIVGINMAIQMRRGDPGEGGEHFRGVLFIAIACVIASTAGPLIAFLGDLSLH